MFVSKLVLSVLLSLAATPALGALAPRASGTPSCTYTCPTTDKSGWQLVGSKTPSSTSLVCYYYPSNQSSDRYYCQYDSNTGALTADKDAGFCKSAAVKDKCTRSYDVAGVYDAYKAQRERRAAAPAPTIPEYMNARAGLKKRKMLMRRNE